MTTQNSVKKHILIDVDGVLKSRNPKLYKWLPQFFVIILKRIIHQKEMNAFLKQYGHLEGLPFLQEALDYLGVSENLNGEENLPSEGSYLFVSNHPLGGLDGLLLMRMLIERYGEVKALINDLLLNVVNLRHFFLGVNLFGTNSKESIRQLNESFDSGAQILFFPAGLVSRKVHGKVQDLKWKKTFIVRAKRHKLNVVPIYVEGKNSRRFYSIANIRRKLGIKTNYELVLLPDELFRQQNNTIGIRIGKTIPYETFDSRFNNDDWAAKVREHVYRMSDDYNIEFDETSIPKQAPDILF